MKICLIMPLETHLLDLARLSIGAVMEPMGLTYLAAMAQAAGHLVRIIDRRVVLWSTGYDLEETDRQVLAELDDFGPDIVGFHLSTVMLPDVRYLAPVVRSRLPQATLVVGGPHADLYPAGTLEEILAVDIAVRGEGELTLLELAEGFCWAEIRGIAYRRGTRLNSTESRPLLRDLDVLPLPSRDLIDMSFFLNPYKNVLVDYTRSYKSEGEVVRMGELLTSRGCPFQCAFCTVPRLCGRAMRYHSAERVVEDLLDLVERGANYVYMNDDVFTLSRRRVSELCDAFVEAGVHRKVQWVGQSRAEHVDLELLLMMKRAGCVRIEFGFESGSPKILKIMHKATPIESYYRAAELARRAGLSFQANIIFGYPGETAADVAETIEFLIKVKPDSVLLNAFWPLPGTSVWDQLRSGRFVLGDKQARHFRYELNKSFLMPVHPFLSQYNFSAMTNEECKKMFWRLLEYAPEAYEYLEENRAAFEGVAEKIGGIFATS